MTYDDAIAFWYGRINYEVRAATPADLKLERMCALLARVGDPHRRVRTVHVTGTKGKGSTAAMIAAVLRANGYRVGLFTSPHLIRVEERIQVDGVPISSAELTARIEQLVPAVEQLEQTGPPPTFFEIGTALGFLHFVHRRCDVAVVEVGLGGRFDSTNVCHPLVSIVTSVGLDHMAQLGNTVESIAYQKAGIFKPGVPAVSGVTASGPRGVIEQVAAEGHTPLVQAGVDFEFEYDPVGQTVTIPPHPPYQLGLLGRHQGANAAVAVAALEQLRKRGLPISDRALRQGLAGVRWPARIELVSEKPAIVLDTAHNVPSVEALLDTLSACLPVRGRKAVVFAVSSDKQYPEMLKLLAGYFDDFHLTKYGNNPRCVPPEALADLLAGVTPQKRRAVYGTAAEAWAAARRAAGPEDLVCVTGSVFLAGELQTLVGESPVGVY
ncbi:MAG: bifunctional folylpolyglutamate synthase/dihydrofolate synthase [Fimbriiglobus sp.]|jgi:dihydrofolate synthase/folylpolyglutamate synthase|nr:bifunctional folylpolyglutamate synthase/dihydrofolate synthase [Fimbriiglobus sp.]